MFRYLLPAFLVAYSAGGSFAQSGKQAFVEIYSDSNIKVELQYNISANSCDQGGKQHKFQYRVTGRYRTSDYYLNWKMDYIDCNGNMYYQQNSLKIGMPKGDDISGGIVVSKLDDRFTAQSIEQFYYDVTASPKESTGSGLLALQHSKAPVGIDAPDQIFLGQTADITVRGGALGIGAQWVWYEGHCGGKPLGKGKSIRVSPGEAATYFVRAEGKNNTTTCVQKTIEVDKKSAPPDAIMAKTKICRGENTTLSVSGGHLGLGANWVWYQNGCGSKKFGTGNSITVSPTETGTYFVRAEGQLNTTNCVSLTVSVFERSTDPVSIEYSGANTICEGESIQLKVKGGRLSTDAIWKWYGGSCGGNVLATGSAARLSPSASTTIYARGEGECNNTACVSLPINVEAKSYRPKAISKPESVYKGVKTTLTLSGGRLSPGAQWQWYEGGCGTGRPVGTGASITVRTRKTTKYFVRSAGKCDGGDCAEVTITPLKTHYFHRTYLPQRKKFLHLGLGLGLEWLKLPLLTQYTATTSAGTYTDTSTVTTDGIGLLGEFAFHPVITEWFSIGLIPSFSAGTTTRVFSGGDRTLDNGASAKEEYVYKKFNLQMEMAFGFKPFKFLVNLHEGLYDINYKASATGGFANQERYAYDQTLKRESVGFGFRLGQYTDANSDLDKSNFDLIYHLTKNYSDTVFDFDFDRLSQWNVGFGVNWWKHSKFRFRLDVYLPTTQDEFQLNKISFKNAAFQASLIWNRNWFY